MQCRPAEVLRTQLPHWGSYDGSCERRGGLRNQGAGKTGEHRVSPVRSDPESATDGLC